MDSSERHQEEQLLKGLKDEEGQGLNFLSNKFNLNSSGDTGSHLVLPLDPLVYSREEHIECQWDVVLRGPQEAFDFWE